MYSSLTFDIAFKCTFVNRRFHSLNEGSNEIAFTIPLNQSYDKHLHELL